MTEKDDMERWIEKQRDSGGLTRRLELLILALTLLTAVLAMWWLVSVADTLLELVFLSVVIIVTLVLVRRVLRS